MTYEEITDERYGKIIKKVDLDGNVFWIPINPSNTDYQQYLATLN